MSCSISDSACAVARRKGLKMNVLASLKLSARLFLGGNCRSSTTRLAGNGKIAVYLLKPAGLYSSRSVVVHGNNDVTSCACSSCAEREDFRQVQTRLKELCSTVLTHTCQGLAALPLLLRKLTTYVGNYQNLEAFFFSVCVCVCVCLSVCFCCCCCLTSVKD